MCRSNMRRSSARIFATVFILTRSAIGDPFGNEQSRHSKYSRAVNSGSDDDAIASAIREVDPGKLREYLKFLTAQPHIAAQKRDDVLTDYIMNEWINSGLDRVELATYDFYLSWPNQTNPNKIYLLDGKGKVRFTSKHKEDELRDGDDSPNFIHAFSAFSPAGEVEGELVYVNYGRTEDMRELEDMGVSAEGKICIARYGKVYRGSKVDNCWKHGGIAIIMYTDPAEVAPRGTTPDKVYPNSFYLPGSGIQRGLALLGEGGDPLSPGWPSIENAYRLKPEEAEGLPKIPAQPIGYDDAKVLLEKMGGKRCPDSWRGNLEGVDYNLGPEMKSKYKGWKVKVKTNNYFDTKKSSNVIGYIKGAVEPDRYVFLSNHRDAWGYGAVDPSSGTAQLLEVVRSLGELHKKGWRPRRTIVFCSWASEEYGLQGSYEWVFHKLNKLMSRSVGLVNTDICVSGPIIKPSASPVLRDVVYEGLKHTSVPVPKDYLNLASSYPNNHESYYEFWKSWWNQEKDNVEEPEVGLLGPSTDHEPFAFYAGVPGINMHFKYDTKKHPGMGLYPPYHTGFDTFYLMDKILDPDYKIHRSCAQASIHMLANMADSVLLPYNLQHFPKEMKKALKAFEKNNVTSLLNKNDASLTHLEMAVEEFSRASDLFEARLQDLDLADPLAGRIANDQMMQLDRVFLMPSGLPGRPGSRHSIFSPAKFNSYGASAFPGLSDLLHEIELLKGDEALQQWKRVRKHISDLMITVKQAADFLSPPEDI